MFKKKLAWIILVTGLMINNIGLFLITGDSFDRRLPEANDLYVMGEAKQTGIVIIDEEIPAGQVIRSFSHDRLGYILCVTGLSSVLIVLAVWRKRETSKSNELSE